jgi:hypothetical protein
MRWMLQVQMHLLTEEMATACETGVAGGGYLR